MNNEVREGKGESKKENRESEREWDRGKSTAQLSGERHGGTEPGSVERLRRRYREKDSLSLYCRL